MLNNAIFIIGLLQLSVLIASSLVPQRLEWRQVLLPLPLLARQLFWVYGGYVVLSIVSLGLICLFNSNELASGTRLARSFCLFGTLFWGIRLSLQLVLDAKPFLTTWWLWTGYHLLTLLFITFTTVFFCGVFH